MTVEELIVILFVGAVAGWLAGILMKGRGFGLLSDIVIGVIGALLGGFVLGLIGITLGGIVGSIIKATIGAVLLVFIIKLLKKV